MKNSKYKNYFIFFTCLSIFIILDVPILPSIIQNGLKMTFDKKTKLSINKADSWAKFPGKLLPESMKHEFKFFSYNDLEEKKLKIASTFKLNEEIKYSNMHESGKEIDLIANKSFTIQNESNQENIKIPSIGLFEAMQTLANPSYYQRALISIGYLNDYILEGPFEFFIKVFSLKMFDTLFPSHEASMKMLVKYISREKAEKILSNEEFGMKNYKGFYKWALLIGNPEKQKEAKWIQKIFGLDKIEIENLLSEKSDLGINYNKFVEEIKTDFKIDDPKNDLVYLQLSDTHILSDIFLDQGIKSIIDLNKEYDINTFETISPEMETFYKSKNITEPSYKKIKLNYISMRNLISKNTRTSLLENENLIKLSIGNKTNNSTLTDFFGLNKTQVPFVTEYFFEYLVNNYIYRSIEEEQEKYNISPLAKTYSNFMQKTINDIYKIFDDYELYNIAFRKYAKEYLDIPFPKEDRCEIIMQKILHDQLQTSLICQDEYLNMLKNASIDFWLDGYRCIAFPNDCDRKLIDRISKILPHVDPEIIVQDFFEESTFFGSASKKVTEFFKNEFNCEDTCSDMHLIYLQNTEGKITKDVPSDLEEKFTPCDSVRGWDQERFEEEPELYKQLEKQKDICKDNCNPTSISQMAKLYSNYSESLKIKNDFEKLYTLALKGKDESSFGKEIFNINNSTEFFAAISEVLKLKIFEKKTVLTTYKSPLDILFGNDNTDKFFIDIIKNGEYINNFNPKLEKTTEFIGFPRKNSNEVSLLNNYKMSKNEKDGDKDILRGIVEMNKYNVFNMKKREYSPLLDSLTIADSPLYNLKLETGKNPEIWLTDGYMYRTDDHKNTIYYFDDISGRVLKFNYKKIEKYNHIQCRKYVLDEENLNLNLLDDIDEKEKQNYRNDLKNTIAKIDRKVNKPMVIYPLDMEKEYDISSAGEIVENSNFICVEPASKMMIRTNLSFIYSINTGDYSKIYNEIPYNKTLPIFIHNRQFEVGRDEFSKTFNGIVGFSHAKIGLIVVGVIMGIIFVGSAIFFYILHSRHIDYDESEYKEILPEQQLIPGSRDITFVN